MATNVKNNLAALRPDLVLQWAEGNGELRPDMFSLGSKQKIWWECSLGHKWQTSIQARTRAIKPTGCPYCAGKKVWKGFNDLATLHPELVGEWSDRNLPLTPEQVQEFSHRNVWWICRNGHEWSAKISKRSEGHGCPYCAGNRVVAGINDFGTLYPELAKSWSKRNHDLFPHQFGPGSEQSVWWICDDCGGEWSMMIRTRIKNQECPYCKRFKQQVEREREQKAYKAFDRFMDECQGNILRFYVERNGIKMLENSHDQTGISLQFYFPDIKGAIEMSSTHDRKVTGRKVENVKNDLCRKNGIKMIRILEADDVEYDDCICIQRRDRTIESYQEALQEAFDVLEIGIIVDIRTDWEYLIQGYSHKQ